MVVAYFDTSALVKLALHEAGDDIVIALWNGCAVAVSSRLVYPEVCSALAAAHRNHRVDAGGLRRAMQKWDEEYWPELRPVEVSDTVGRLAGRLVRVHALSGADGVHLASALTFADADPVIASWDKRLAAGASAEGLRTVP